MKVILEDGKLTVIEGGQTTTIEVKPAALERLEGELHATLSECGGCGRSWEHCDCEQS